MTPIPTPLVGLPNVTQGLPEALDNAPSFGVPDVTANEKFSTSVLNEQMQAMLDALNPAIVPEDELTAMSEEADEEREDNPDRANALDATVAAGKMANLAASPLFRVFVLIIIVKIILSILRKIPGVRGVPSFNKCLKDVLDGGTIAYTSQNKIVKGWANYDGAGRTYKAGFLVGESDDARLYTLNGLPSQIFSFTETPLATHIRDGATLPLTYKDASEPDNDETLNAVKMSATTTSSTSYGIPTTYGYHLEELTADGNRIAYVLSSSTLKNNPNRYVNLNFYDRDSGTSTTLQYSFCKLIMNGLYNPSYDPLSGDAPFLSSNATYKVSWSEVWSMDTSVAGQIDLHVCRPATAYHYEATIALGTNSSSEASPRTEAPSLLWKDNGSAAEFATDNYLVNGQCEHLVYRFETDTTEKENAFLKFIACSYVYSIENAFVAMPTSHTDVSSEFGSGWVVQLAINGANHDATLNSSADGNGFGFLAHYCGQTLPTGDDLDPIPYYQVSAKGRYFTVGTGSLESREEIDVGDGMIPPSTSYQPVILSSYPTFSIKAYKPCTFPPASADSKLRMLVENDADKFLVMATFGCCYTEEIWERFVELKRLARSTRHFVRQ